MDAKNEINPQSALALCSGIRAAIGPLNKELQALPGQLEGAKKQADAAAIRSIKQRERDVSEQLLTLAADKKREVLDYLEQLGPIASSSIADFDSRISEAKKEREALRLEFEKRLAEKDQEVSGLEQLREGFLADYRTADSLAHAMSRELDVVIAATAEGV